MPETPERLLARLDALGIVHRTVAHRPVFTVAESKALRPDLQRQQQRQAALEAERAAFQRALAPQRQRQQQLDERLAGLAGNEDLARYVL